MQKDLNMIYTTTEEFDSKEFHYFVGEENLKQILLLFIDNMKLPYVTFAELEFIDFEIGEISSGGMFSGVSGKVKLTMKNEEREYIFEIESQSHEMQGTVKETILYEFWYDGYGNGSFDINLVFHKPSAKSIVDSYKQILSEYKK